MIVEPTAYLIEQDFLVSHNHDELVPLYAIIHNAALIFCSQQRKYISNAPVVKPHGNKHGEGRLRFDDPSSCIAVNTDEPPVCVADILH